MVNVVSDVISNGIVLPKTNNTFDIEKGPYRVVVAADENGNWVLTAFDYINSAKEKEKQQPSVTDLTPNQTPVGAEAGAVASETVVSTDKGSNNSEKAIRKKTQQKVHRIQLNRSPLKVYQRRPFSFQKRAKVYQKALKVYKVRNFPTKTTMNSNRSLKKEQRSRRALSARERLTCGECLQEVLDIFHFVYN